MSETKIPKKAPSGVISILENYKFRLKLNSRLNFKNE